MKSRVPSLLAIAALALTACSSHATPAETSSSQSAERFESVEMTGVVDQGITRHILTFTFATEQSQTVVSDLNASIPSLLERWENETIPLMEQAQLRGILQAEYRYLNPDGNVMWDQVLMQDESGSICIFDAIPVEDSPTRCIDI